MVTALVALHTSRGVTTASSLLINGACRSARLHQTVPPLANVFSRKSFQAVPASPSLYADSLRSYISISLKWQQTVTHFIGHTSPSGTHMTSRNDTKELHFSFIYNAQVHNSLYSIQLAEDPTVSERNAW